MDEKHFQIGLTEKQILGLINIFEHIEATQIFFPDYITDFYKHLIKIQKLGCWKHNRIRNFYRYKQADSTHAICPECNPTEFKEYEENLYWIRSEY